MLVYWLLGLEDILYICLQNLMCLCCRYMSVYKMTVCLLTVTKGGAVVCHLFTWQTIPDMLSWGGDDCSMPEMLLNPCSSAPISHTLVFLPCHGVYVKISGDTMSKHYTACQYCKLSNNYNALFIFAMKTSFFSKFIWCFWTHPH